MDKIVNSIQQIDLSDLKIPVAAVYNKPLDYPDKCVARIFDLDKPTNAVVIKDELESLMNDIKDNTNLTFLQRGAEDVESLVGVWM